MTGTHIYIQRLLDSNTLREPFFRSAIQSLGLPQGSRGLDAGCGIGLQSSLLAEAVGPHGRVTGIDIEPEYLSFAQRHVDQTGYSGRVTFYGGDAGSLPFEDRNKEESSLLNRIVNLGAFTILTLLWLVFALALIFNWALLDSAWSAFRSWPLVVQLLAGLLFSPVVAGLWIWETSWPAFLRFVLVTGLGWATFFAFDPRHLLHWPALSEGAA